MMGHFMGKRVHYFYIGGFDCNDVKLVTCTKDFIFVVYGFLKDTVHFVNYLVKLHDNYL